MANKILIVEDELIIANNICSLLENNGFIVKIGCRSAKDAIEVLSKEKFDLVIIDYFLSSGSKGVEVANYLLLKTNVPYIYITSAIDYVFLEEIKESRPLGVIFKPYKSYEIETIVSIVLNNKVHSNIDVFRNNKDTVDVYPLFLKEVIEYIKENINSKIEVKKLTELTPWTYDYFIRIFSKYLGLTPYKYVIKKKIEKSKALLTETEYPISEIAIMLSFESYSNFNNAFKREVNCNPEYYRKINKIKKIVKFY